MKLGIHITYGYTVTDKYFQNFRSKVKVVGRRKVKKRYLAISRERMVVEIRDWCQNVGEYNTYNFCIWHFGLCVIVSKIDRCRSSDPPYEIAINPIFRSYRVSDVIIQSFLNRSRWNLVHTMSQPTWWRGGRGLPSLIALFNVVIHLTLLQNQMNAFNYNLFYITINLWVHE